MTTRSATPDPVSAPLIQWDYSDTEWWGWFILALTWGVFVMGMGSCFEVWSWGSPDTPADNNDDGEAWPIVGYYPVLIVLTGVMAWIWVFIAWVGMKYFRHAKM